MIDVKTAYNIFKESVKNQVAEGICEYSNFYIVNNSIKGDFVMDMYMIDKNTGKISELDLIDLKNIDEEEYVAFYEIKDSKVTKRGVA